jgi:hypothetical protein
MAALELQLVTHFGISIGFQTERSCPYPVLNEQLQCPAGVDADTLALESSLLLMHYSAHSTLPGGSPVKITTVPSMKIRLSS